MAQWETMCMFADFEKSEVPALLFAAYWPPQRAAFPALQHPAAAAAWQKFLLPLRSFQLLLASQPPASRNKGTGQTPLSATT